MSLFGPLARPCVPPSLYFNRSGYPIPERPRIAHCVVVRPVSLRTSWTCLGGVEVDLLYRCVSCGDEQTETRKAHADDGILAEWPCVSV